jgi:hypothetical protein
VVVGEKQHVVGLDLLQRDRRARPSRRFLDIHHDLAVAPELPTGVFDALGGDGAALGGAGVVSNGVCVAGHGR